MRLWPSRGLWRQREFLKLWAAQTVSAFGSRITRTALPVIAVLSLGASPLALGGLGALSVAPGVLVALLLAGRVDRSRKRALMVGADLVRAGLVLTIPLAAWAGALSVWQLYVIAAAVGASTTLFELADTAYLPALVGKRAVVEGNAKLQATESIAEVGGPGIAGVLIDAVTAPVAMVFDALSYVWSAAFVGAVRADEQPATDARSSLAEDLRIGLRHGLGNRLVRPTFLAMAVSLLSGGFFAALYMLFALRTLGLSPAAIGLVIGVGGIGAFFGALFAEPLRRTLGIGRAMILCLAVGQAGALLIPMARGSRAAEIALLVAHQLLGDGFTVAAAILMVSLRQEVLPLDVQARANATEHVFRGVLMPIGALVAGLLGHLIGVRETLWIGFSAGLLAPVMLLPLARVRSL